MMFILTERLQIFHNISKKFFFPFFQFLVHSKGYNAEYAAKPELADPSQQHKVWKPNYQQSSQHTYKYIGINLNQILN